MLAITFIGATKQGFGALELQRHMGFTRFQAIFDLCHKLRVVMCIRDDKYRLEDMIEYGEAYITKEKNSKRGREALSKRQWLQ